MNVHALKIGGTTTSHSIRKRTITMSIRARP